MTVKEFTTDFFKSEEQTIILKEGTRIKTYSFKNENRIRKSTENLMKAFLVLVLIPLEVSILSHVIGKYLDLWLGLI